MIIIYMEYLGRYSFYYCQNYEDVYLDELLPNESVLIILDKDDDNV